MIRKFRQWPAAVTVGGIILVAIVFAAKDSGIFSLVGIGALIALFTASFVSLVDGLHHYWRRLDQVRASGPGLFPPPSDAAPLNPTPHQTPISDDWVSTIPPVGSAPRIPSIDDVLALTPTQFEELTNALLTNLGYAELRRTGGSGDLAADLIGRDPQGRRTIVQCKRYARGASIGSPVVQTFIGMMSVHHRAERGVIVSTAGFTQPAIDLHGIALVDGRALLLLLHLTDTPIYRLGSD